MNYSLTDLFIIMGLIVVAMGFWHAMAIRELAYQAVKHYLRKEDLVLLDDNVALRAVWFKKDKEGILRFWRSYNFEFSSTGHERYKGQVVMLGRHIESITLEPYRIVEENNSVNSH